MESLSQLLLCPICQLSYSQFGRTPNFLPCHHVFCISCINALGIQKCPTCRTIFNKKDLTKADLVLQLVSIHADLTTKFPSTAPGVNPFAEIFSSATTSPLQRNSLPATLSEALPYRFCRLRKSVAAGNAVFAIIHRCDTTGSKVFVELCNAAPLWMSLVDVEMDIVPPSDLLSTFGLSTRACAFAAMQSQDQTDTTIPSASKHTSAVPRKPAVGHEAVQATQSAHEAVFSSMASFSSVASQATLSNSLSMHDTTRVTSAAISSATAFTDVPILFKGQGLTAPSNSAPYCPENNAAFTNCATASSTTPFSFAAMTNALPVSASFIPAVTAVRVPLPMFSFPISANTSSNLASALAKSTGRQPADIAPVFQFGLNVSTVPKATSGVSLTGQPPLSNGTSSTASTKNSTGNAAPNSSNSSSTIQSNFTVTPSVVGTSSVEFAFCRSFSSTFSFLNPAQNATPVVSESTNRFIMQQRAQATRKAGALVDPVHAQCTPEFTKNGMDTKNHPGAGATTPTFSFNASTLPSDSLPTNTFVSPLKRAFARPNSAKKSASKVTVSFAHASPIPDTAVFHNPCKPEYIPVPNVSPAAKSLTATEFIMNPVFVPIPLSTQPVAAVVRDPLAAGFIFPSPMVASVANPFAAKPVTATIPLSTQPVAAVIRDPLAAGFIFPSPTVASFTNPFAAKPVTATIPLSTQSVLSDTADADKPASFVRTQLDRSDLVRCARTDVSIAAKLASISTPPNARSPSSTTNNKAERGRRYCFVCQCEVASPDDARHLLSKQHRRAARQKNRRCEPVMSGGADQVAGAGVFGYSAVRPSQDHNMPDVGLDSDDLEESSDDFEKPAAHVRDTPSQTIPSSVVFNSASGRTPGVEPPISAPSSTRAAADSHVVNHQHDPSTAQWQQPTSSTPPPHLSPVKKVSPALTAKVSFIAPRTTSTYTTAVNALFVVKSASSNAESIAKPSIPSVGLTQRPMGTNTTAHAPDNVANKRQSHTPPVLSRANLHRTLPTVGVAKPSTSAIPSWAQRPGVFPQQGQYDTDNSDLDCDVVKDFGKLYPKTPISISMPATKSTDIKPDIASAEVHIPKPHTSHTQSRSAQFSDADNIGERFASTSSESESKCGSKKPTGHSSSSTAASAGIMGTDEDTATCSEPYIGPQLYNAASVGAYSCVGPESTAPSATQTAPAIDIHAPVSRLQQCSVRELNQLVTKLHLVRPVGAVERADLLALVLGERVRLRDLQASQLAAERAAKRISELRAEALLQAERIRIRVAIVERAQAYCRSRKLPTLFLDLLELAVDDALYLPRASQAQCDSQWMRRAYKRLMIKIHPDKHHTDIAAAEYFAEVFKIVKRRYDAYLVTNIVDASDSDEDESVLWSSVGASSKYRSSVDPSKVRPRPTDPRASVHRGGGAGSYSGFFSTKPTSR